MIVKPVWDEGAGWFGEQLAWWKANDGKEVNGKLIDNPDNSGERVFLPDNLPKGVKIFLYEEECQVVSGEWE